MKLRLLTDQELKDAPNGTELGCIDGKKVVVGTDDIDDETRGGRVAYGYILPDDSTEFTWDTAHGKL